MVYDESKLVRRWAERLLSLSDSQVAKEYQATPTNRAPVLPLAGLQPASSHDVPAVQVADLIAGVCADLLTTLVLGRQLTDWHQRLREARILRFSTTSSGRTTSWSLRSSSTKGCLRSSADARCMAFRTEDRPQSKGSGSVAVLPRR